MTAASAGIIITSTAGDAAVSVSPAGWETWLIARIGQLRARNMSAIIFYDAQTNTLRVWSGAPAGVQKLV